MEPALPLESDKNFRLSTFRERMLEHSFLAELLQEFWTRGEVVEVARSEVDTGYDLVLEARGVLRHVQLKSTRRGGKAAHQIVQLSLGQKRSGCVVWIEFADDQADRLRLAYRFLGGLPGESLLGLENCRPAKHAKADMQGRKSVRPGLVCVPKSRFSAVHGMSELCEKLFGATRPSGT